jgi:hypothetical protein
MATPINGVGYSLQITNNAEICSFVITVMGDDGLQYHLMDHGASKNSALVKKLLAAIATPWPKEGFQIIADNSQLITDIP